MENINVITHYGTTPIGTLGEHVKMDDGMQLEESLRIDGNKTINFIMENDEINRVEELDHNYLKRTVFTDDGITEVLLYNNVPIQVRYVHIYDDNIVIDQISPDDFTPVENGVLQIGPASIGDIQVVESKLSELAITYVREIRNIAGERFMYVVTTMDISAGDRYQLNQLCSTLNINIGEYDPPESEG